MFKEYQRIFIFDTETTGLSPDNSEIIELGGLLLEKEDNPKKFTKKTEVDFLIKNDLPILNSHIHHITEDMCQKDGIEKQELFDFLKTIFGDYEDTLIVAYNTPFDMRFVQAFMNQIDSGYRISNHTLDLLEVAKSVTGLSKGNKLCDMLNRYNIVDFENSHRALDDVLATFEVMKRMMRDKNVEIYIRK